MPTDNVILNAGSGGDTVAADGLGTGTVKHPLVKMEFGPNGTATQVADVEGQRLPVDAHLKPSTAGGLSNYHAVFAASTNPANIKASPGQVYAIRILNIADYPIFVRLHDTAGAPVAGTGVKETYGVQAGMPLVESFEGGIAFAAGIGITVTKFIPDADTTPVNLNDGVVDVYYK